MTRETLLQQIATTIGDYRQGEILQPTPDHVDRWVRQFSDSVQEPILTEMAHVLSKTYFSKAAVDTFISSLVTNGKLADGNPCAFWRNVKFLDIQAGGNPVRIVAWSGCLGGRGSFVPD